MGAQAEWRAHLRKAREFLDAARLEAERDLYSAAASSAVLAGINAKDTICLRLVRPHQQGRRPPLGRL